MNTDDHGKWLPQKNGHRGGLAPDVGVIWPDSSLFESIGGRAAVRRIIDGLYDRITSDAKLNVLFFRDQDEERTNQKRFFEEFLGGADDYNHHRGVRRRHRALRISRRAAVTWLRFFTEAMADEGVPEDTAQEVLETLTPVAMALVNESGSPEDEAVHLEGRAVWSAMLFPGVSRWWDAAEVAAGGDHEEMRRLLDADTDLLRPGNGGDQQRLLFQAASHGQLEVVRLLVERGADVNAPDDMHRVMVTPWCIATRNGHRAVADYLREHGAVVDLFSAAWLGDIGLAKQLLAEDADLLHAHDPAMDYAGILPIHHALAAREREMVSFLLGQGSGLGGRSHLLIAAAADDGDWEMAKLLAAHGADAARIGPGNWVKNPDLAKFLVARGADVNQPEGRWLDFCTNRSGQRDDPELIAALIDRGVDIAARNDERRTCLHLAAEAGHLGVLEILLQQGADVDAKDRAGATPLQVIRFAGPAVDRLAVATLLLEHGADPRAITQTVG